MGKRALPWIAGFALFFMLSLDFWNWSEATPLILGMPYWVVAFILLNLLLGAYFLLFSIYYWRDE